MKFSVPISSLSSRGLKNLIFSFYNKAELLSKATDGNFFVSKDFCYSIGDWVFKEQIIDKIQEITAQAGQGEQVGQGEAQEADENKLQHKLQLLGIRLENRTDDYDGDLVFTGFNQSEKQEEQQEPQEKQEAVQEETAQVDAVQEKAVQEDAVQVADKPNFDPAFDNTPTVGTETAANDNNNNAVEGQAGELADELASEAFTQTPETPLVTLCGATLRDRAISVFLDYLINHCNDVKHVALEDEETRREVAKNEKFAMRAWFTQLGWRGKEDNELRSYFYDNLEGNTAFRTEEDHARWAARWQPKYFDKHPEMKWVLEEQKATEESVEESATSLIVPEEAATEDSAEAVSATVGTEESVEVDQETATDAVAEAEVATAEESEFKNNA